MQLQVHTVGGVVAAGAPILDIVPEQDELIVEARVSPMDIDRVQTGLGATVRLSGLRHDEGSRLSGSVRTISADRVVDERTDAAYYRAQVVIAPADRARLKSLQLQPGMPAEVMINTGQRTMLAYLADPIRSALQRSFRED
jgi:epimerase transport system membrane fusion protein